VEIVRVGTLPVSAINLGLVAGLPGLATKSARLSADITQLGVALAGQVEMTVDFPPTPANYAVSIGASLNPIELAAAMTAFNPVGSADVVVETAAKLALVTAQLAPAESLAATLTAGLQTGGCAGFSYSGPSGAFGSELKRATAAGFGRVPPDAEVQAIIIATESFTSWQAFSQSMNTGASARSEASRDAPRLAFLGELPGASWNPGTASIAADINLLLADLRGEQSGLQAQLELCAGANLPDPQVVVDAGASVIADVGIDGLLDNMVNVRADFTGAIDDVAAKLSVNAQLIADISAQLSAGGLTFWTYTGSAAELGEALATALAAGIPGGNGPSAPAYGLVIVGTPANMQSLGTIIKTS
jgi:hypothetical protein